MGSLCQSGVKKTPVFCPNDQKEEFRELKSVRDSQERRESYSQTPRLTSELLFPGCDPKRHTENFELSYEVEYAQVPGWVLGGEHLERI